MAEIVPLTRENLDWYGKRIRAITAEIRPQWGMMGPAKLMRHFKTSIDLSLGEGEVQQGAGVPVVRTIMRVLFFHVFTNWPKAKVKAPEYFTPEASEDFAAEQSAALDALEHFVDEMEKTPTRVVPSPAFGPMTLRYYRHLHGVHFRHHFRQYGVL